MLLKQNKQGFKDVICINGLEDIISSIQITLKSILEHLKLLLIYYHDMGIITRHSLNKTLNNYINKYVNRVRTTFWPYNMNAVGYLVQVVILTKATLLGIMAQSGLIGK